MASPAPSVSTSVAASSGSGLPSLLGGGSTGGGASPKDSGIASVQWSLGALLGGGSAGDDLSTSKKPSVRVPHLSAPVVQDEDDEEVDSPACVIAPPDSLADDCYAKNAAPDADDIVNDSHTPDATAAQAPAALIGDDDDECDVGAPEVPPADDDHAALVPKSPNLPPSAWALNRDILKSATSNGDGDDATPALDNDQSAANAAMPPGWQNLAALLQNAATQDTDGAAVGTADDDASIDASQSVPNGWNLAALLRRAATQDSDDKAGTVVTDDASLDTAQSMSAPKGWNLNAFAALLTNADDAGDGDAGASGTQGWNIAGLLRKAMAKDGADGSAAASDDDAAAHSNGGALGAKTWNLGTLLGNLGIGTPSPSMTPQPSSSPPSTPSMQHRGGVLQGPSPTVAVPQPAGSPGPGLPRPLPTSQLAASASHAGQQQLQQPSTKRTGSDESVSTASTGGAGGASWEDEAHLGERLLAICQKIDADGNGSISQLELLAAVREYPDVAALIVPGTDVAAADPDDEVVFDAVDSVFEAVSCGKQRISCADLAAHFQKKGERNHADSKSAELRAVYTQIDTDGNGSVSKLELFESVQRCPPVAQLVLSGAGAASALNEEETFEEVRRIFEVIAGGKKRFDFADFEAHFRRSTWVSGPLARPPVDRASKRVFIIGPGFGRAMNPRQSQLIEEAGFQIHWCWENLPNPEQPNFDVRPYLPQIRAELERFQPHVVACGSKGGAYIASLWLNRLWCGPTLLINAHPCCGSIPAGMSVVLCQGSNDEVYPTPRSRLEEIMATGDPNKCFFYYTANSGLLPTGHYTRYGDQHNMASLVTHDCLPRLLDALLIGSEGTAAAGGPELHLIRTWRDRLTPERLDSEAWLGYHPDLLRRRWSSRGRDDQKLYELPRNSEEFQRIVAVFKAQPRELPAYALSPPETWERVQVRKIERVENSAILDGCTLPYYNSVCRDVEDQGITFEPGVHTSWAFHGAAPEAIDSIVNNPLAGFQPLASGSRGASLWGSGTYFARDAKYVADGGFCGQAAADGSRRMLMCLLFPGMPCLGDPTHKGVLPFRRKPHRYNSSVDCLASPEIYITQQSGAAHAAYLITFT